MSLTRRRFLASSAAVAGAPLVRSLAAGAERDKVRVGVVGVADRGAANLAGVSGEDVVALCEVDEPRAAAARKQFPRAAFFTDYRKMVDQVGKSLDAVVVSTPDHTHAHASLLALRAGKHVYCEKPLARSVGEARLVAKVAAERKLVTQMGTQIHAGDNYRRVVEAVRAGVVGPVESVDVWCSNRPYAGRRQWGPRPGVKFSLDQWLGPVPAEFFYAGYQDWPHFHWRWWWEFGGGVLGDMGCHFLDLPFWALNLTAPTTVSAESPAGKPRDAKLSPVPEQLKVRYAFPAAGERGPVALTWYHGQQGPWIGDGPPVRHAGFASGVAFTGPKGVLIADYGKFRVELRDKGLKPALPVPSIAPSVGHHKEWLDAIRGTGKALCSFDYSGPLTEAVLLGNVAHRTGETLQWDSANLKVTNVPKATELVTPPTRKGWELA